MPGHRSCLSFTHLITIIKCLWQSVISIKLQVNLTWNFCAKTQECLQGCRVLVEWSRIIHIDRLILTNTDSRTLCANFSLDFILCPYSITKIKVCRPWKEKHRMFSIHVWLSQITWTDLYRCEISGTMNAYSLLASALLTIAALTWPHSSVWLNNSSASFLVQ